MPRNEVISYDMICFDCLAYEFDRAEEKTTERRIKSRLRYRKAGAFDPARVEYIRNLRNDLYREIVSLSESGYYAKTDSEFSSSDDFNIDLMTVDYSRTYDLISESDIRGMITLAVYHYYLR